MSDLSYSHFFILLLAQTHMVLPTNRLPVNNYQLLSEIEGNVVICR